MPTTFTLKNQVNHAKLQLSEYVFRTLEIILLENPCLKCPNIFSGGRFQDTEVLFLKMYNAETPCGGKLIPTKSYT